MIKPKTVCANLPDHAKSPPKEDPLLPPARGVVANPDDLQPVVFAKDHQIDPPGEPLVRPTSLWPAGWGRSQPAVDRLDAEQQSDYGG